VEEDVELNCWFKTETLKVDPKMISKTTAQVFFDWKIPGVTIDGNGGQPNKYHIHINTSTWDVQFNTCTWDEHLTTCQVVHIPRFIVVKCIISITQSLKHSLAARKDWLVRSCRWDKKPKDL